jgi:hypothetical protein
MELKEVARVLNTKYSVLFRAALYRTRGITKICRLSWLINSALVYEHKCRGRGSCGILANEYLQMYTGAQINFEYLTPYLTCVYRTIFSQVS